MNENELDLEWDGERIKQVVKEQVKKHTPAELTTSLHDARAKVDQFKQQIEQIDIQKKDVEKNLAAAEDFIKQILPFEQKCIDIQLDHLQKFITANSDECKQKAIKSSGDKIAEAPDAYSQEQKDHLAYLDYQKALATFPKITERVSPWIIQEHMFVKPIFGNVFKDEPVLKDGLKEFESEAQ